MPDRIMAKLKVIRDKDFNKRTRRLRAGRFGLLVDRESVDLPR
jgi:hypothetical protein